MMVRLGMVKPPADTPSAYGVSPGKEIELLHEPILKWCLDNRAPFVHARSDKRSGINVGAPDFIIGWKGKVFWIECKTKTGKMENEQIGFKILLELQGLEYHVIRTMEEFYALMK